MELCEEIIDFQLCTSGNENTLILSLILVDYSIPFMVTSCKFSILISGATVWTREYTGNYILSRMDDSMSTTFDNCCSLSVNGKISVTVDAALIIPDKVAIFSDSKKMVDNIQQSCFHSLYKDDTFADVTITSQGREFKAHKAVLAAQSPVFKKMFQANMKEKETNVVEMSDISPTALANLLEFIYTGEAPNLKYLPAKDLLYVANMYELTELSKLCQIKLMEEIQVSDAIEILHLARLYDVKNLKEFCLKFISSNFSAISKTPDWISLSDEEEKALLYEVLNFSSNLE